MHVSCRIPYGDIRVVVKVNASPGGPNAGHGYVEDSYG
jgi:hypothetical protein